MRATAAFLLLLGACSKPVEDLAAVRAEIETQIRLFHTRMNGGDIEAVLAMLDPEFSIIHGGERPAYGKEAAANVLRGFVELYKTKDLINKREPTFGEIRVRVAGDMATATYHVVFLEPQSRTYVEIYTHLFRRSGGKWLLFHDHRSPRQ